MSQVVLCSWCSVCMCPWAGASSKLTGYRTFLSRISYQVNIDHKITPSIPYFMESPVVIYHLPQKSGKFGYYLFHLPQETVISIGAHKGGLHSRHVGGQNKRKFVHKVCIKMEVLPEEENLIFSVHQHGRHDVTLKPSIWHGCES